MEVVNLLGLVLALGTAQGFAAATDITRVEVTGVQVLTQEDVESALELGPGDKVERTKVVRTAENLQTLYRRAGFEQTKITSRLLKKRAARGGGGDLVLEFVVTEGKPTRVSQVEYAISGSEEGAMAPYWAKVRESLAEKAGFKPGDILEQGRVTTIRRALQEALASEEFIGTRVEEAVTATVQPPPGTSKELLNGTARWVRVAFKLDLGDRVSFGFVGAEFFTTSVLSNLIEEQRSLGLGKDYLVVLKTRLEEEYRANGFPHVKITPYIVERPRANERHVTFRINEGPRVRVVSLSFEGNARFTNAQLKDEFDSRAVGLLRTGYYVEKDVQKVAELVVEWVKSQGFLSARLVTVNAVFPQLAKTLRAGSSVKVVVYIYEGDQTTVSEIRYTDFKLLSPDQLNQLLGLAEGQPLNLFAFNEGLDKVRSAYRREGYLDFDIQEDGGDPVVDYQQENRLAVVHLRALEGPQFRLSKVQVEGNELTLEHVVLREVQVRAGEVLSEDLLNESETRLRRLGIFTNVAFRLYDDPETPSSKVLRITVSEADRWVLSTGPGFLVDQDVRIRGTFQISSSNLWGRAHSGALNAVLSRRFIRYRFYEGQGSLNYIWPWFPFLGDTTLRPSVVGGRVQYLTFNAETLTASATFERTLLRRPNLTGSLSYSVEYIRQFDAEFAVDNQQFHVTTLAPSFRLDMRDNPLAPTRGFFASTSYELTTPYLGSQATPYRIGYHRVQVRTDFHLPLFRQVGWYFSARGGWERSSEEGGPPDTPIGAIPLIKQFALGGPNSLRGFYEQELSTFNVNIREVGYINLRTQVDFPFSGALKLGVFFDVASLRRDLSLSPYGFLGELLLFPRASSGFGLHYQTPIGPVNLDWGFKLDPRPGEDTSRIDFSIGVI